MASQSRVSSAYKASILELDGAAMGLLQSFEGGSETADVITEAIGPDRIQKKHLTNIHPEEIVLTFDESMNKAVYDWIASTLRGDIVRKSGAVTLVDYSNTPVARLDFLNALITEIGFPALDATSKSPGAITLKLAPESTTLNRKPQSGSMAAQKTKSAWLVSNFRLAIDGIDCSRVTTVAALPVKQTVSQSSSGQIRSAALTPTVIEFPNLVVTLRDDKADTFYAWHQDFVILGNDFNSNEKSGSLQYLSPDLKTTLFTLNFSHLGIFRLAQTAVASGQEFLPSVVAAMYCEQFTLAIGELASPMAVQSTGMQTGVLVPPVIVNATAITPSVASNYLPAQPCNPQSSQPAIQVRSLQRAAPALRFRA